MLVDFDGSQGQVACMLRGLSGLSVGFRGSGFRAQVVFGCWQVI